MHELKPHHLTLLTGPFVAHTEKRLRHVGLVDHNLISRARAALTEEGTKKHFAPCAHTPKPDDASARWGKAMRKHWWLQLKISTAIDKAPSSPRSLLESEDARGDHGGDARL